MKNTILILVGVLCMSMIACQPPVAEEPAIDMDALRAEIQAMEDAYAKGANEKKPELILSYYADDAQRLPDGEPMVKGMKSGSVGAKRCSAHHYWVSRGMCKRKARYCTSLRAGCMITVSCSAI